MKPSPLERNTRVAQSDRWSRLISPCSLDIACLKQSERSTGDAGGEPGKHTEQYERLGVAAEPLDKRVARSR